MKKRLLGRTGIEVSEIGCGLWGMGDWSGSEDDQSFEILRRASTSGITFFDSAQAYGRGRSDRLLGKLRKQTAPGSIVIASKIAPKNWQWPGSPQDKISDVYPYEYIIDSAKAIAQDSGGFPIDLLQFHVWDDAWASSVEWQRAVEDLKAEGTIKAFGISANRWEPTNVLKAADSGLIDTIQVIYNIFDQSPEDELFPYCLKNNIGVIARVPLDEGGLTGSLTYETQFPQDDWRSKYFGPENLRPTVDRANAIMREFPDQPLSQLALRFILSNPVVSTTIVGMRTQAHLAQNVMSSDLGPLPSSTLQALRKHRWDRSVTPWAN